MYHMTPWLSVKYEDVESNTMNGIVTVRIEVNSSKCCVGIGASSWFEEIGISTREF